MALPILTVLDAYCHEVVLVPALSDALPTNLPGAAACTYSLTIQAQNTETQLPAALIPTPLSTADAVALTLRRRLSMPLRRGKSMLLHVQPTAKPMVLVTLLAAPSPAGAEASATPTAQFVAAGATYLVDLLAAALSSPPTEAGGAAGEPAATRVSLELRSFAGTPVAELDVTLRLARVPPHLHPFMMQQLQAQAFMLRMGQDAGGAATATASGLAATAAVAASAQLMGAAAPAASAPAAGMERLARARRELASSNVYAPPPLWHVNADAGFIRVEPPLPAAAPAAGSATSVAHAPPGVPQGAEPAGGAPSARLLPNDLDKIDGMLEELLRLRSQLAAAPTHGASADSPARVEDAGRPGAAAATPEPPPVPPVRGSSAAHVRLARALAATGADVAAATAPPARGAAAAPSAGSPSNDEGDAGSVLRPTTRNSQGPAGTSPKARQPRAMHVLRHPAGVDEAHADEAPMDADAAAVEAADDAAPVVPGLPVDARGQSGRRLATVAAGSAHSGSGAPGDASRSPVTGVRLPRAMRVKLAAIEEQRRVQRQREQQVDHLAARWTGQLAEQRMLAAAAGGRRASRSSLGNTSHAGSGVNVSSSSTASRSILLLPRTGGGAAAHGRLDASAISHGSAASLGSEAQEGVTAPVSPHTARLLQQERDATRAAGRKVPFEVPASIARPPGVLPRPAHSRHAPAVGMAGASAAAMNARVYTGPSDSEIDMRLRELEETSASAATAGSAGIAGRGSVAGRGRAGGGVWRPARAPEHVQQQANTSLPLPAASSSPPRSILRDRSTDSAAAAATAPAPSPRATAGRQSVSFADMPERASLAESKGDAPGGAAVRASSSSQGSDASYHAGESRDESRASGRSGARASGDTSATTGASAGRSSASSISQQHSNSLLHITSFGQSEDATAAGAAARTPSSRGSGASDQGRSLAGTALLSPPPGEASVAARALYLSAMSPEQLRANASAGTTTAYTDVSGGSGGSAPQRHAAGGADASLAVSPAGNATLARHRHADSLLSPDGLASSASGDSLRSPCGAGRGNRSGASGGGGGSVELGSVSLSSPSTAASSVQPARHAHARSAGRGGAAVEPRGLGARMEGIAETDSGSGSGSGSLREHGGGEGSDDSGDGYSDDHFSGSGSSAAAQARPVEARAAVAPLVRPPHAQQTPVVRTGQGAAALPASAASSPFTPSAMHDSDLASLSGDNAGSDEGHGDAWHERSRGEGKMDTDDMF